jgi:hypothetical protein
MNTSSLRPPLLALIAAGAIGCGGSDGPPAISADAAVADGSPADAGATTPDAGAVPDGVDAAASRQDAMPPGLALIELAPLAAPRAAAVALTLTGTGFAADAVVVFGGQQVPTTRQSDTRLTAAIAPALTMQGGYQTVWIETTRGSTRSNLVYFSVTPPPGAPEVLDFEPDNGAPGDKIQLVGFNITGEPLMVTDSQGHTTTGAAIGTINSPTAVLESVQITVPAGWQSGPLTVATSTGTFRAKVFTVGRNLARLPGVTPTASSEYGGAWTIARGADNDLFTSWFSAAGDCVTAPPPTCLKAPWYMLTFPSPQTVTRIAVRGNREYTSGYDFVRARVEVRGEGEAVLWSGSYHLPEPDRDLDVLPPAPVAGARAVRFTSEEDESEDPGLGEIEVF